ncbi:ABC transporter permease [Xenorhabdus szentirmaii]|uniref:ABC-2 type transport system permease protein n=1 Tax=Xenorhabdus szentirmaii DSM 16338 TaxID=1427518 RepID=W1J390_9GAMM|nr:MULTISPECIES: ABC-2 family transporter protein [Xenorhabdus]MBD2803617.1 ABC-2 family transporter protein [Xenorhabdus sp. ZM]PHM34021.1 ABC transporter permease [Xenorhabdus szentirmaii DSM 16338]CDL84523.1 putative ABC-2 type transport system permease protein [Xenorhabdus szentirmaii DSM 16338]
MLFALIKVRLFETFSFRAEFLLWLVTLSMPLIMLVFWRSVTQDGSFQGYTTEDFNLYYIAVLVTTILTSCNSVWEVNENIRLGELSFWLMRPIHPFINYLAITIAELILSLIVAIPILILTLAMNFLSQPFSLPQFSLFIFALSGAFLINQSIHLLIGGLTFWIERSLVIHKMYVAASSVLSGYMFPLALLPKWAENIANWLPFRFVISLPVEILTGKHSLLIATQWVILQFIFVALLCATALLVWRQGVRRYLAFG